MLFFLIHFQFYHIFTKQIINRVENYCAVNFNFYFFFVFKSFSLSTFLMYTNTTIFYYILYYINSTQIIIKELKEIEFKFIMFFMFFICKRLLSRIYDLSFFVIVIFKV